MQSVEGRVRREKQEAEHREENLVFSPRHSSPDTYFSPLDTRPSIYRVSNRRFYHNVEMLDIVTNRGLPQAEYHRKILVRHSRNRKIANAFFTTEPGVRGT